MMAESENVNFGEDERRTMTLDPVSHLPPKFEWACPNATLWSV